MAILLCLVACHENLIVLDIDKKLHPFLIGCGHETESKQEWMFTVSDVVKTGK